jgi:hypothetical protein
MKVKPLFIAALLGLAGTLFVNGEAIAQKGKRKTVHVKSYTKKNGTHVRSHTRSRKY